MTTTNKAAVSSHFVGLNLKEASIKKTQQQQKNKKAESFLTTKTLNVFRQKSVCVKSVCDNKEWL